MRAIAVLITCLFFLSRPALAVDADDPCITIPRPVVAAALGAPVTAAMVHGTRETMACIFRSDHFYPYATIGASRFDSAAEASLTFNKRVAAFARDENLKPVPVPGIGDAASDVAGLLFARKGTAIYVFSYVDGEETSSLRKRVDLAKRALAYVRSTTPAPTPVPSD